MMNLKKGLSVLLVLSILLVGGLISCAAEAPAEEGPIRLKAAFWVPPHSTFGKGQEWAMREIELRSKGSVIFERYWAQSLVGAKDIPDALAGGIADVGSILPAYYPGKFPLCDVGSLPGIAPHQWPAMSAFYETWQQVPELREESAERGVRLLAVISSGPYFLLTKTKIESLDDIKGLKIRSLGYQAKLIEALGGVPVSIPAPEVYDAMQKGTIDGVASDEDFAVSYGFHKPAKYFTQVPIGASAYYLGISIATWDSLPADIQKMMEEVVPDAIIGFAQTYEIDGNAYYRKIMIDDGIQAMDFPADQAAKVTEIARSQVWDSWVSDMESKGLPGRKVFDTYNKAMDKYLLLDPMKY